MLLRWTALMTPTGMPMTTEIRMLKIMIRMVGSRLLRMFSITGRLLYREVPRSPWRMPWM